MQTKSNLIRLFFVSVFLVPQFLFAAGTQETATELTREVDLEIWHSLSESFGAPQFEDLVRRFDEEHELINATTVYQGGYTDTLRAAEAALAGGAPPAISMFEQTRGAGFVDAGAILPLDDLIANDPDVDAGDFFPRLMSTVTIDGQIWGIPYNTSTPLIYYNRDMFREAGLDPDTDFPTTWDELLEVGREFVARENGELVQWAFGLPTAPGWMFDAFLGQAGGSFLNDDGSEFVFNSSHAVEMMEFWLTLRDEGVGLPGAGTDDFFAGNQAMVYQSTAVLENMFENATFDLGVAPMWGHHQRAVPIGGANFYIFDQGDDQIHLAAWEFLKWVTAPERATEFAIATGYHAPRIDTLDTPAMRQRFEDRPEARITYDQLETSANARTLVPFWGEIHALMTVATQQVLLEDRDPQAALDEAVDEANRLLAAYAR